MRRFHLVTAVLLPVAFTAVACSGGGGGATSSTSPTGGNNSPTTSGGNTPGATVVNITEYSFSPGTITVKAGSTVRWADIGTIPHTTTADNGEWDSGSLAAPSGSDPYGGTTTAGSTYERTFNVAGTYKFHCSLHPPAQYPGFTGTIVVTP